MCCYPTLRFLFVLCCLLFLAGESSAQKPIPNGPDEKTASDNLASLRDYLLLDVDEFDALRKDGGSTPKPAVEFIRNAVDDIVYVLGSKATLQLADTALEVAEKYPDHPIVALRAGRLLSKSGRAEEARQLVNRSHTLLGELDGLHRARLECIRDLVALENRFGTPANAARLKAQLDDALIELCEADQDIVHQRHIYAWVDSRYWALKHQEKGAFAARIWKSNAHDWIRNMFKGQYHRDKAWHDRGGGYAHTVSDEGWESFHKHIALAAKHWTTAWEIAPTIPTAAGKMIMASLSVESDLSPRDWFDRAVAAEMDYPFAYRKYCWTLLPRWDGSHEEMYAFAEECLATERFDTDAALYFVRAIFAIAADEGEYHSTLRKPEIFEKFVATIEKAAADESRSTRLRHGPTAVQLKSVLLNLGTSWQRPELAKRMDEELGQEYDATLANDYNYNQISRRKFDEQLAVSETLRDKITAKTPNANHSYEEYLEKWIDLSKFGAQAAEGEENWRTERYLKQISREADYRARFQRGEWIPLDLHLNYDDWMLGGGVWQESNGKMVGRLTTDQDGLRLWHSVGFHPGLELEGVVEPLESMGNGNSAGLMIGYLGHIHPSRAEAANEPNGRVFWVDGKRGTCGIDYLTKCRRVGRVEPADSYKIRVKAWTGYYIMYVNDKLIWQSSAPTFRPDGYIGLGSLSYSRGNAQTAFSNVRIRRLMYDKPMSDTESADERIAYFEKVRAAEPDETWAVAGLAESYCQAGQFDRASQLYEQMTSKREISEFDESFASGLIWFLATCSDTEYQDAKRAIKLAQTMQKRGQLSEPRYLDSVAAAYAADGQFDKAIKLQQTALDKSDDNTPGVAAFYRRLRLYENEKPYIDDHSSKSEAAPARDK